MIFQNRSINQNLIRLTSRSGKIVLRIFAGLLGIAGLAGCATVHPQAGFNDVSKAVDTRIHQQVIWDDDSKADRQIAQRTKALLAHPLTADAAVEVALLNNQSLQADYEKLGVSQANLVSAGLLTNPVLSADIRFPGRPYHGIDASIDQTFLDLLLLPARKKLAKDQFAAQQAQVTADVLALAARVRREYYRYQAALQLAAIRHRIVLATGASADAARHLRQAGNTSELTYDLPLELYEHSKLQAAAAQAAALEAHERLGALMGLWGTSLNYSIPAKLPAIPSPQVPLANLESIAIKQSLALAAQKRTMQALKQQLKMAHVGWLLSGGTVGLAYVRDPDVRSTLGPSISIPIPIFNQGQPAVARQAALYMAAARQFEATAVNLRATVRQDWLRLAAARQEARFYAKILLPLRKHIVNQQQVAYNGMYVGVFALLTAKEAEIRAGTHYVESLRDYWVARARLRQDLGGQPLPGMAPATQTQPAAKTDSK